MEEEESSIFPEEAPVKTTGRSRVMITTVCLSLLLFALSFARVSYWTYSKIVSGSDGSMLWWQILVKFLLTPWSIAAIMIPAMIIGIIYRRLAGWLIIMCMFYYIIVNMLATVVESIVLRENPKFLTIPIIMLGVSLLNTILLNTREVRVFFKIPKNSKRLPHNIVAILFMMGMLGIVAILWFLKNHSKDFI